nr:MAG TPA: hypothetical protein [Caudoviricetes sp.]
MNKNNKICHDKHHESYRYKAWYRNEETLQ